MLPENDLRTGRLIRNYIKVFGHGHRLRPNNSFKPRPLRGSAAW